MSANKGVVAEGQISLIAISPKQNEFRNMNYKKIVVFFIKRLFCLKKIKNDYNKVDYIYYVFIVFLLMKSTLFIHTHPIQSHNICLNFTTFDINSVKKIFEQVCLLEK